MDGTYDNDDVLYNKLDNQKMEETTVLAADLMKMKLSEQDNIFYSIRMDLSKGDHTERLRIEFKRPEIEGEEQAETEEVQ